MAQGADKGVRYIRCPLQSNPACWLKGWTESKPQSTDHPCVSEPACRAAPMWVPWTVSTSCWLCMLCATQAPEQGWYILNVVSGAGLAMHAGCSTGCSSRVHAACTPLPDQPCFLAPVCGADLWPQSGLVLEHTGLVWHGYLMQHVPYASIVCESQSGTSVCCMQGKMAGPGCELQEVSMLDQPHTLAPVHVVGLRV